MQNCHQISEQPRAQSPAEFRPNFEDRLFTANDAVIDPSCEVYPTARLLYDSLPQDYRDVFKNCPMYLSKHVDFVKFLKYMSEIDVTKEDADHERLKPLGIQIPTEEGGRNKWQCGVVNCNFKGTLQHLYTHLQKKTHLNLAMATCRYCQKPFYRRHDRTRHEENMHRSVPAKQTGSSHSKRGLGTHSTIAPKTRAGMRRNTSENQLPAYTDPHHNDYWSASSDPPSSSEGDDQHSVGTSSLSPPSSIKSYMCHYLDANQPHQQAAWPTGGPPSSWGSHGAPKLNQVSSKPPLAGKGILTSSESSFECTRQDGYDNVAQSWVSGMYEPAHSVHSMPHQAEEQSFFTRARHQSPSSHGLMLPSSCLGLQSQGGPSVTPIQPSNSGGMHAHIINNTYHINSSVDPPRFLGNNLQPAHTQWPVHMPHNPPSHIGYSQARDYLHPCASSQQLPYGTHSGTVPGMNGASYEAPGRGLINYLQQDPIVAGYPRNSLGYGTSIKTPCTLMTAGRGLVSPCLHQLAQADAFKNRSLGNENTRDNVIPQEPDPNEATLTHPRHHNTITYGEKLGKLLRILILGFRNPMSSTLPRYATDVVDEKATTINRPSPSATFSMRCITLLLICCLVALLLSGSLLYYPEWRFGVFTL